MPLNGIALLIILRKNQDVVRGQQLLFKKVRYFFYITNDRKRTNTEMLLFYRGRSDHENDIDQLKNSVKALRPSSNTLLSNWALMVIAALAWDMKAWFGLLLPYTPKDFQLYAWNLKGFCTPLSLFHA